MRKTVFLFFILPLLVACVGKPIISDPASSRNYVATSKALDQFKSDERLASYFDEAVAYIVFPGIVRAGSGFGLAYGKGWGFAANTSPIGRFTTFQFMAGPHLGFQSSKQILFFKTENAFELFQKGGVEFAGQANVALLTFGASATPSYNENVAIFTRVNGGLMLEASASGHGYFYSPIE